MNYERINLIKENLESVVERFDQEPLFSNVIVTMNTEEDTVLIPNETDLTSRFQYVVAAGPSSVLKPGDKVMLDLDKMMSKERIEVNNVYEEIDVLKLVPVYFEQYVFNVIPDRFVLTKMK